MTLVLTRCRPARSSYRPRGTLGDVKSSRRVRLVRSERGSTHTNDATDLAAVLRSAGLGDRDAFAVFYDQMAGMVHGVVLKTVRSPAIAEEVTQDVFLELWRLSPRYDESKGSPRGWAAAIAHRRAVDRVRSEESARARDDQDVRRAPESHAEVEDVVGTRFEQTRVAKALTALTDTQREAVTLAYYGGHTYREVAVLLRVPEGTVKTRIRDGMIKLRDLLGDSP